MNVGEAVSVVSNFNQDLANEPDPSLRAWYEHEYRLGEDFLQAQEICSSLGSLATALKQVERKKTEALVAEVEELKANTEEVQKPDKLTPEEILAKRVERRLEKHLSAYVTEVEDIEHSGIKRSKKDHQQKMALRKHAKRFCDISDMSDSSHLVLRQDMLKIVEERCQDEDFLSSVFDSCAEFARQNPVEITANPKNMAEIITGATESDNSDLYEGILKGLFSANPELFAKTYINLSKCVFELLGNYDASVYLAEIVHADKPFVPLSFIGGISKYALTVYRNEDAEEYLRVMEAGITFQSLIYDLTGVYRNENSRMGQYINNYTEAEYTPNSPILQELNKAQDAIFLSEGSPIAAYDPVEVVDSSNGQTLDLEHQPVSDELASLLSTIDTFRKRMEHLSPFSYGVIAAKRLLTGSHMTSFMKPISPTITAEFYMAQQNQSATDVEHDLKSTANEIYYDLLSAVANAADPGVRSYEKDGKLRLIYTKVTSVHRNPMIVVLRPKIELDQRKIHPIEQLSLNLVKIGVEFSDEELAGGVEMEQLPYALAQENEALRREIGEKQERYFGRRPVKFTTPARLKKTGLDSISLRCDDKYDTIKAKFELEDGVVEVELNRDLSIKDIDDATKGDLISTYYENLILKLSRVWLCSREVRTSEGIVGGETGNNANFGHFSYLRVRSDGTRFNFSEAQSEIFREERGGDLSFESERRKLRDETGQERNTTYVRENYDPNKPPLEVYYSEKVLEA